MRDSAAVSVFSSLSPLLTIFFLFDQMKYLSMVFLLAIFFLFNQMKQIAHFSMVFLLAFVTVNHSLFCVHTDHRNGMTDIVFCFLKKKGVFGMNAKKINPGSNEINPGSNETIFLAPLLSFIIVLYLFFFFVYYLKPIMRWLAWSVLLLRRWWCKKSGKDKDKDKRGRPIDRMMRDDYEEEMKWA